MPNWMALNNIFKSYFHQGHSQTCPTNRINFQSSARARNFESRGAVEGVVPPVPTQNELSPWKKMDFQMQQLVVGDVSVKK